MTRRLVIVAAVTAVLVILSAQPTGRDIGPAGTTKPVIVTMPRVLP